MKKVNEIINELRDDTLKESPDQLSEYLVMLSASLNEAGNKELEAEVEYAKKWEEIKLSEKMTDKMCDMKTKQTDKYVTWQQMRIANKTIQEVIRSIKKRLASLSVEYQSGQF